MSGVDDGHQAMVLALEARSAFDVEAAITHLSAAVRHFTAAGENRPAAMASAYLGDVFANGLGNATAARAWFARARAMVADEPPCIEQGWVAVAAMGCDVGDPDELLAAAELALDRARHFGDVNLETKALADAGLAHVQAGRIEAGMAMLDEAMALVCGPADDVDTVGKSACSFFTACYYSADFDRASSWADLMRQRGVIGPAAGAPIFLSNHCDTVQACLLCELGRWSEAEDLLVRATDDFERTTGAPSFHSACLLADLRIRQGRLADAEALLAGKEQAFEALLPTARLHLRRGDHELAAAAARRGLRAVADDRLRAVELLTVLVAAELGRGDPDAAAAASDELAERVRGIDNPILVARSAPARACQLAAAGDHGAALELLEDAVTALGASRAPYQRLLLLLASARLRDGAGDRTGAVLDATAAAAVLADLDVAIDADDRALLDRLVPDAGVEADRPTATLARDGKWWSVSLDGTEGRLRDTKGLRYLAELVAVPGVERHALDLVDRIEGVGDVDRRAIGDAGEVIDTTARDAYRRRLESLRDDIEDALAGGRLEVAEAMQAEHDELVHQLAQAFGIGGRSRKASSAAERARLNVTRALRTAIATIAEVVPTAGASLDRSVRTGSYCAYDPGAGEIRWIVHCGLNEVAAG